MDRFVARLNIDHYRELLAKETDEAQRQRLVRLIAEEEAKLKAAETRAQDKRHG
jgi:hypothetical protein